MKRRKLPYQEGDWFAIPLQKGGYGLGLVARSNHRGIILGYYFGPRRDVLPSEQDTRPLCAKDAVLLELTGDLHLLREVWPIIYRPAEWHRSGWPLPAFRRIDVISGDASRIEYSEDTLEEIAETPAEPNEVRDLPIDGLSGAGALEVKLTRRLSVPLLN